MTRHRRGNRGPVWVTDVVVPTVLIVAVIAVYGLLAHLIGG